ncbi:MAG: hypothetical protein JWO31_2336 [Phycisphaerales bacterium]|nr:hypothetical protein [Phycisphaerales bacterium]
MLVAEKGNSNRRDQKPLTLRLPDDILGPFEKLVEKKGISRQVVIERLLRLLLAQDDVTRTVLIEQRDLDPELLAIALRRLEEKPKPRRKVDVTLPNQPL